MKALITYIFLLLFLPNCIFAQFPGAAGTPGSTALSKDSSIFVAWAKQCTVYRGFQDISNTSLGYVSAGDSSFAIGQADGISVVSLGDGGQAIVTFEKPIKNGVGFDFAVFENAFIDEFLELAFVEVSSDGINYYRFKATSNTQTDVQVGPFDYNADPTLMNNLAGKYRAMYGTPFDLEEMTGIQGLNVDSITHIKIIDVVGSINPLYGSFDQNNQIINEHFPTPFPQGGFDLDAVGVIHQQVNGIKKPEATAFSISPNPFENDFFIMEESISIASIKLLNSMGETVYFNNSVISKNIDLKGSPDGMYVIYLTYRDGKTKVQKLLKISK